MFFNFNSSLHQSQENKEVFELKEEVIMIKENETVYMKRQIESTISNGEAEADKTTPKHYNHN